MAGPDATGNVSVKRDLVQGNWTQGESRDGRLSSAVVVVAALAGLEGLET